MRFRFVQGLLVIAFLEAQVFGQAIHGFDRLEPISPYSVDKNAVELQKLLIKGQKPLLWMLAKSPFTPEYGITLTASEGPALVQNFRITVVRLSRPSWEAPSTKRQFRDSQRREKHLGLSSQVVEIPSNLAEQVIRAWRRGVLESRYRSEAFPPPPPTPVAYEFFAEGGYFGKTWGPEPGMPALMVELATSLVTYVESAPEVRGAHLQNCLEASRRIQSYEFH